MTKEIVRSSIANAFEVDGRKIRCDGEMWCLTDLWSASGMPNGRRPAQWLRDGREGHTFVDFLRDSLDVPFSHIVKTSKKGGLGGGGETWAHWQIALAYAKALSHEFHARVNEVYRAFMAGQLVPRTTSDEELIRYQLRLKALDRAEYESCWDIELKLELARLRKVKWDGRGPEPHSLMFPYGRTWRIILGDKVYEELKKRNPVPRDGTLHGQWLQQERMTLARREDLVIALVLARRASRWTEYEAEMRSHFRRAPIQLRLVTDPKQLKR